MELPLKLLSKPRWDQGKRFRTILAGTARIFHSGTLTDTETKAESYCSKYQGVPARFGCSDRFWSFLAVFAFPAITNLNGFFWKNFILTATSGHHWSINMPNQQQNHLLLRFSHLDLLLSHCNLPSFAPLVFFLYTVDRLWMFYVLLWWCTCTSQAVVLLTLFSLGFSAKSLEHSYQTLHML